MADQRLPFVDADDGDWGDILNQYLSKEHVDTGTNNAGNGGHKNITIAASTGALAPLTFNNGTPLSSPLSGSVEFLSNRLYFTPSATRKVVAVYDTTGTVGEIYYRNNAGGDLSPIVPGNTGRVLTSTGTSSAPTYQDIPAAATQRTFGFFAG